MGLLDVLTFVSAATLVRSKDWSRVSVLFVIRVICQRNIPS